jgi:hypothetical protein
MSTGLHLYLARHPHPKRDAFKELDAHAKRIARISFFFLLVVVLGLVS